MAEQRDPAKLNVVYQVPWMEQVTVRRDLTYKAVGDMELKMDIYSPEAAEISDRLPAVLFIHGDAPWERLRSIKDAGQYVSWGKLAAATGFVGIAFTHRSTEGLLRMDDVAADIEDAIAYVRHFADELGVDRARLAIWVCSAGGPYGLRAALRGAPYVRCAAAYYPIAGVESFREWVPAEVSDAMLREYTPLHLLKPGAPPLLIAKAGQDRPHLNATIDAFVTEALQQNVQVDLMTHPDGQHAFDLLDDDDRSRAIIRRTLEFFKEHLS